jgi:hypothetical protein
MVTTEFLATESGAILTTEDGRALLITQENTEPQYNIQQFDFSVNLLKALLWQYNDAVNLQALLQAKADWYFINQSDFWYNWIADVFNLSTANQFGLYVWGIILGLPLYVNNPYDPDEPTFGFDGSGGMNFDNGILGQQNGSSQLLPMNTQRIALQMRYFQLTSSGTVPETNRMLKLVFGNFGTAYLIDNHDMTQTYIFNFPLTWDLIYLFTNFDILPRPAGVASNFEDATLEYFGFNSFNYNFDNGILQ